jgi:guanylate kinase
MARALVVTGPSGVGKGTLIKALLERVPGLALSVSATTRPARPGEVDGLDYHFLSTEEFEKRLLRGEFLEHAMYAGNQYGTPRSELERGERGLVLEIEVEGARQVRERLPEALQVFIAPPSPEALKQRLVGRGTDSEEQVQKRLARAEEELAAQSEFKHVIVNDDVERAVAELERLTATILEPDPQSKGAPEK